MESHIPLVIYNNRHNSTGNGPSRRPAQDKKEQNEETNFFKNKYWTPSNLKHKYSKKFERRQKFERRYFFN